MESSLHHLVNLAEEAATQIEWCQYGWSLHLPKPTGKQRSPPNRDIEIFPVLKRMLERILGTSPYASPTDMGANMVGFAIVDNDAAIEASQQEIIRRAITKAILDVKANASVKELSRRLELLLWMIWALLQNDRKVTVLARQKEEETGSQPWPLNCQTARW